MLISHPVIFAIQQLLLLFFKFCFFDLETPKKKSIFVLLPTFFLVDYLLLDDIQ